ncbi:unnamed protein product [Vitrella brassicaformis CCMP3155]|uniref:Uncharacterized protein n=1 Tax=Vitrella brassicaformis (strain CCMP3155) TaxID=1169540 RepID=A0A0G4FUB2_VITBC|nr:unnamed protein product [Vitrella brassicaformis CCMP3155]|eukprot:CEM17990.1 unnamed protein product [Vitrella brassicaformis CCMP3155]
MIAVLLLALLGRASGQSTNEAGFRALFGTSAFVAPTCSSATTVSSSADSGSGSLREALGMLEAEQPETETTIRCIRIDGSISEITVLSPLTFSGSNVYVFPQNLDDASTFPVLKPAKRDIEVLNVDSATGLTLAGLRFTNTGSDPLQSSDQAATCVRVHHSQDRAPMSVAFYRVSVQEYTIVAFRTKYHAAVTIGQGERDKQYDGLVFFTESAIHGNTGTTLECKAQTITMA